MEKFIPIEKFSLEQFLRYFVSGAFFLAMAVAAYPNLHVYIDEKITAAGYIALAPITGSCLYAIYSVVFKLFVFDRVAFMCGWSYPGHVKREKKSREEKTSPSGCLLRRLATIVRRPENCSRH